MSWDFRYREDRLILIKDRQGRAVLAVGAGDLLFSLFILDTVTFLTLGSPTGIDQR